MLNGRRAGIMTAYLVLVLFTALAGDAWRYTVSWWGFGVIVAGIGAVAVTLLIRDRAKWWGHGLPIPLVAFLVLATASIAWSFYPAASALGVLTTFVTTAAALALAVEYDWRGLLRGLDIALRLILALSILFELFVSVFVRHPVLPLWVRYDTAEPLPKLLYWSRNELFEVFDGGRIQGIVGNASTLAFMALLALIVFGVRLAAGDVRRAPGVAWLAIAVVTLLLTRSATVTVALVAVVLAAAAILVLRRIPGRAKFFTGLGMLAVLATGIVAAVLLRGPLLSLLGRSEDLTNRVDIWTKVLELAQQRPAAGWGWVSYWPPWVPPFDDLLLVNRVQVMHAHNAWLDVFLQLGVLGLIVFGALVLSTTTRATLMAIDAPRDRRAITMAPFLLMVALIVQSFAESRLLVEYGWLLLVLIAVTTRTDRREETGG